jgi:aminomethyltransferase
LPKGDFIAAQALTAKSTQTDGQTTLVCLKMVDRGIPRTGYPVVSASGEKLGFITSGTHSPTLDAPIGIAKLSKALNTPGTEVFVEIRGVKTKAEVVASPFYKKKPLT